MGSETLRGSTLVSSSIGNGAIAMLMYESQYCSQNSDHHTLDPVDLFHVVVAKHAAGRISSNVSI